MIATLLEWIPKGRSILVKIVVVLMFAGIFGCTGPKQLVIGDAAYNAAVRQSADKELLLNIVRLRYLDTIEFLSIPSISSSSSFSVGLGASGGSDEGIVTSAGR